MTPLDAYHTSAHTATEIELNIAPNKVNKIDFQVLMDIYKEPKKVIILK